MLESTKVNFSCIHVQTCMHTKSIRIHVHTVMSCGTYLSISRWLIDSKRRGQMWREGSFKVAVCKGGNLVLNYW